MPGTLANGYLLVDNTAAPGAGHRQPDDPVPRHRRPLHAERRDHRGDAVLGRGDRDTESGRDDAQRRHERWPRRGLHVRPRALDRLHAAGQPGVGRPGARRRSLRSARTTCSSAAPPATTRSPDWVDLDKVAIPQADEQQRLLANLMLQMNRNRKPLPRFWYFPRGLEGGRRHDRRRPRQRRHGRPLRHVHRRQPRRLLGRQLGVRPRHVVHLSGHADHRRAGCDVHRRGLRGRRARHHRLRRLDAARRSRPTTHPARAWSRLAPEPAGRSPTARTASRGATGRRSRRSSSDHGIRLDTNYYYWPPAGCRTGPACSPARACRCASPTPTARLIDVYQATTQMTDESGQTVPATPSTRCSTTRSGPTATTASSPRTCTPTLPRRVGRTRSSPRRSRAAFRSCPAVRCCSG